jgi:hypothetical protein
MRRRLTGVSGPWGGLSWENVPGDEEVAKETIVFLEDRRLLFGERHAEDELHCLQSALAIRTFLSGQISKAHGKELIASLRAMRAAARQFVDAAGPRARNFAGGFQPGNLFWLALGDLRSLMGVQVALIADQFSLEVEEDLLRILPPVDEADPSFVPGFEK